MWCECFDEIYVKEIKRKINLQTSGILCRILGWQCDGRQWNRQNITAWHHEIWIVHWTKCVCRSSTFAWRWTYAAMINMSIVSFSHFNFVLFLWVSVDVDSFVPGIRAYTHTHTHPLKSINHLKMKSHFTNTDNGKKGTSHKKCFISLVLFFYYTLTRALSFFKFSFWIDGNLFIKCTSSLSSHVITVEIIDYYRVNSLIYNYCAHLPFNHQSSVTVLFVFISLHCTQRCNADRGLYRTMYILFIHNWNEICSVFLLLWFIFALHSVSFGVNALYVKWTVKCWYLFHCCYLLNQLNDKINNNKTTTHVTLMSHWNQSITTFGCKIAVLLCIHVFCHSYMLLPNQMNNLLIYLVVCCQSYFNQKALNILHLKDNREKN